MKQRARWKNALTATAVIVTVLTAVTAGALAHYTLIDWWRPTAACLLAAVPVAWMLRRPMCRLLGSGRMWAGALAALVMTASLLTGAFYSLNFFGSDGTTRHECTVSVVKKFTERRYRTRRLNRHTSVRGEPYTVYRAKVRMPDGRLTTIDVSAGEFARMSTRRPMTMMLERGLLGVSVIKGRSTKAGR